MFDQIDQLTLWDVDQLFVYWNKYPPTHVLIGAYLLKGSDHPKNASSKEMLMASMTAAIQSLGGAHRGKLPDYYQTH